MPRCGWFGRLRYALGHAQWPGSAPSQCRPHRGGACCSSQLRSHFVRHCQRCPPWLLRLRIAPLAVPGSAQWAQGLGRHCMALCALAAMLAQVGALESRLEALLDEAEMRRRQARV